MPCSLHGISFPIHLNTQQKSRANKFYSQNQIFQLPGHIELEINTGAQYNYIKLKSYDKE
jgi:hypothetical protein